MTVAGALEPNCFASGGRMISWSPSPRATENVNRPQPYHSPWADLHSPQAVTRPDVVLPYSRRRLRFIISKSR
jgi:hypothetical protein